MRHRSQIWCNIKPQKCVFTLTDKCGSEAALVHSGGLFTPQNVFTETRPTSVVMKDQILSATDWVIYSSLFVEQGKIKNFVLKMLNENVKKFRDTLIRDVIFPSWDIPCKLRTSNLNFSMEGVGYLCHWRLLRCASLLRCAERLHV